MPVAPAHTSWWAPLFARSLLSVSWCGTPPSNPTGHPSLSAVNNPRPRVLLSRLLGTETPTAQNAIAHSSPESHASPPPGPWGSKDWPEPAGEMDASSLSAPGGGWSREVGGAWLRHAGRWELMGTGAGLEVPASALAWELLRAGPRQQSPDLHIQRPHRTPPVFGRGCEVGQGQARKGALGHWARPGLHHAWPGTQTASLFPSPGPAGWVSWGDGQQGGPTWGLLSCSTWGQRPVAPGQPPRPLHWAALIKPACAPRGVRGCSPSRRRREAGRLN